MDNKWVRLSLIVFTGIIISVFVLSILNYFSGVATMNQSYNMNMSGNIQQQLFDLQQQLASIKSMISVGMPTAIAVGLINLWRGFTKK